MPVLQFHIKQTQKLAHQIQWCRGERKRNVLDVLVSMLRHTLAHIYKVYTVYILYTYAWSESDPSFLPCTFSVLPFTFSSFVKQQTRLHCCTSVPLAEPCHWKKLKDIQPHKHTDTDVVSRQCGPAWPVFCSTIKNRNWYSITALCAGQTLFLCQMTWCNAEKWRHHTGCWCLLTRLSSLVLIISTKLGLGIAPSLANYWNT